MKLNRTLLMKMPWKEDVLEENPKNRIAYIEFDGPHYTIYAVANVRGTTNHFGVCLYHVKGEVTWGDFHYDNGKIAFEGVEIENGEEFSTREIKSPLYSIQPVGRFL